MGNILNTGPIGHIIFDHDGTLVDTSSHPYKLYDGIYELLEELKTSGFSLYLWTARPRRSAIEITKTLEIHNFFSEIFCYDDGVPKPNPMGLAIMCDGIDKNMLLHIGDSLGDIEGAHSYGIEVIGACWGNLKLMDKFQTLADYTCSSVDECRQIIRGKFHV